MWLTRTYLYAFIVLIMAGCGLIGNQEKPAPDTLPAWNDGVAKSGVKSFVRAVSDPENGAFVPAEERILVVDGDGTLWPDKPVYYQFYFLHGRLHEEARVHPEWQELLPYKAALNNDYAWLGIIGDKGIFEIFKTLYQEKAEEEIANDIKSWALNQTESIGKVRFKDRRYQPMVEVLRLFQAHDFKVYVISTTGVEFTRPWIEACLDMENVQVIGNTIYGDSLNYMSKRAIVEKMLDIRPIAAIGNADDDLPMMLYSDEQERTNFQMFVHHTDSVREWAYDNSSALGQLRTGIATMIDNGWMEANMARDWQIVFEEPIADSTLVIQ